MTTTFTGEVRIPGSIENGLPSTITLDPQTVILTAGGTELGRWNRTDLTVSREPDGAFRLALGREIVLFNPDSPLEFAILSGMPGAATAPAPTAAPPVAVPPPEAVPPVAAPPPETVPPVAAPPSQAVPPVAAPPAVAPPPAAAPPVTAASPVAAVPPVAATPPPVSAATAAAPPTAVPPPPEVPPSATTPPPAAPPPIPAAAAPVTPTPSPAAGGPPPAAATPQPEAPQAASAPSPAAVPTAPPVAPEPGAPAGQTSGLPPAPPAAAAAAAAAASVAAVPTQPGPVEIRLETDSGAAPPHVAATQETPPPAAAAPEAPPAGSGDFWDDFHEEEREAGVQPVIAPEAVAAAAHTPPQIQLETPEEGAAEESSRVGGWGSGLFTEEDDGEPEYPPAFRGSAEAVEGEDRAWSFYEEGDEDDESGDEDRGWSYDDPKPEESTEDEDPPAFKSPAADRDDLVEKSSRLRDAAAWRPSIPSFSFGGSSLGMRARSALEVLDAVLEENGTEDIPRSFLVGLLGLVGVLALIALIAFVF